MLQFVTIWKIENFVWNFDEDPSEDPRIAPIKLVSSKYQFMAIPFRNCDIYCTPMGRISRLFNFSWEIIYGRAINSKFEILRLKFVSIENVMKNSFNLPQLSLFLYVADFD